MHLDLPAFPHASPRFPRLWRALEMCLHILSRHNTRQLRRFRCCFNDCCKRGGCMSTDDAGSKTIKNPRDTPVSHVVIFGSPSPVQIRVAVDPLEMFGTHV